MTERERLEGPDREAWRSWGPYLMERCWGTVRERPGSREKPWEAFPFEHARSRSYLFGEDGLGGFSDAEQRLCFSLMLWNEQDSHLKERLFGLTNAEGSHGEDVKETYFYLDGLPSHALMRMLYRYPQAEFPIARLRRENALRARESAPFQQIDALARTFRKRAYFDVTIELAKSAPDDLLYRATVVNMGARPAPVHVLPQLWYRRVWEDVRERPLLREVGSHRVAVEHPDFGGWFWHVESEAELLFTENETNRQRLFDRPNRLPYVKDGIDEAVTRGLRERVNPGQVGTRCAAHHRKVLAPGESWTVRARLSRGRRDWDGFDDVFVARRAELEDFYAALNPHPVKAGQAFIQRRAFAGLTWNQCFYHFPMQRWLQGNEEDPTSPGPAPPAMLDWSHVQARDILALPDAWEYPWMATWDLLFQIATYCVIDSESARRQALAILGPRYARPDGALMTTEQDPGWPHPPVHAWAVWMIYQLGGKQRSLLEQALPPMTRNFEWWLRTHQPFPGLFDGGFLGMDNISVLDRNHLPEGTRIAQADSTGWLAQCAIHLLAIAAELGHDEEAVRWLHEFLRIRQALQSLWDGEDHFLYDILHPAVGEPVPLKVRSYVGLIALSAVLELDLDKLSACPKLLGELRRMEDRDLAPDARGRVLLAALPLDRVRKVLEALFDPEEFWSTYGLRSLSRYHRAHPVRLELDGERPELTYEPGLSKGEMMGGNSNWRGPLWAPLNQLALHSLYHYADWLPDLNLEERGRQLVARVLALFEKDDLGRKPVFGDQELFQNDPEWNCQVLFYEFFHGDTGAGLGASHQNGWTAVIAGMIYHLGRTVFSPAPTRIS